MEEMAIAPILNDTEKSSVLEINQPILSPSPLKGEGDKTNKSAITQTIKKIQSSLPKKNFSAVARMGALAAIYDGTRINMSGSIIEPEEGGRVGVLDNAIYPQAIKTIGTGEKTSGNNGFRLPKDVSMDSSGRIYVADLWGNRIQIFDPAGKYLRTLGTGKITSGNDGFHSPAAVFLDSKGLIYVADSENHRIQIFEPYPSLKYLGTIGARQRQSSWSWKKTSKATNTNDGFDTPQGISGDSQGRLYVADTNNNRIQIFDPSWNYLYTIGTGKRTSENEDFRSPAGVFVDPRSGLLYVADSGNARVQIFDLTGKYMRTLGISKETLGDEGFDNPEGISADSKGRIYVADFGNYRVQIFEPYPSLKYLRALVPGRKTHGDDPSLLHTPCSIFVDSNDRIYVVDLWHHRIQIFLSLFQMEDEAERFVSQQATIPPVPQTDAEKKDKPESALDRFKIEWDKL